MSDDISTAVNLYPNPNAGSFKLDLSNLNSKNATLIIVDMLGREVYITTIDLLYRKEIMLNQENLASGKYYLLLNTDDFKTAHKPFTIVK